MFLDEENPKFYPHWNPMYVLSTVRGFLFYKNPFSQTPSLSDSKFWRNLQVFLLPLARGVEGGGGGDRALFFYMKNYC